MTYEYACTACGHAWEAEQSISASALTECPHCHQATAKRQVSGGAGFILKGGGWYADLYSNSGAKKSPEKTDSASSTDSMVSEPTPTTSNAEGVTLARWLFTGSAIAGAMARADAEAATAVTATRLFRMRTRPPTDEKR